MDEYTLELAKDPTEDLVTWLEGQAGEFAWVGAGAEGGEEEVAEQDPIVDPVAKPIDKPNPRKEGPTPDELFARAGLYVKKVPGDGNCMWHGLRVSAADKGWDLPGHKGLREAVTWIQMFLSLTLSRSEVGLL